ncbi:endopeptidase La [candidate division KSB1 bacterium]|nr:MAG: endopeptidase La [candidate division KSB1 bacterium]
MEKEKENRLSELLPVMPLRNTVVFPHQIIPLSIGREKSIRLVEYAYSDNKIIGLVAQKDGTIDDPQENDLYNYGSAVNILKVLKFPDGSQHVVVQGIARIKIEKYVQKEPFYKAKIKIIEEKVKKNVTIEAMMINLKGLFQQAVELAPYLSSEQGLIVANTDEPGRLADLVASNLNVPLSEKVNILEIEDVEKRLQKVTLLMNKELQVLELGSKIQSQVMGEIDKNQREFFLREQMKAIQRELGEEDERTVEIKELKNKIRRSKMPADVKKVANKELNRLMRMPPSAAEYTVSRTYLDWLIDMPWGNITKDIMDVKKAEKILDEDHYGLEKVKKRILEYLSVRKLKTDMKGPILCFVGPPGVGKTSLGMSIARALGRKFFRMSLGGIRDEAEIRGHRRTYIGALPGRIIQGIKRAGSMNPVFMLDEIDKVGTDFRGDPSSALLEVLDPEQNYSFSDHYLDVPFDLSKVMFITTANMTDPIPPALKDRMEMLELPGYTAEEKLHIAKKFLIPKQLNEHGLTKKQLQFSDGAIKTIINSYTKEAGVRNLEREIASVCRGVAKEIVEGKIKYKKIFKKDVPEYLGPEKFFSEVKERTMKTGVATGLAWTPAGGDLIFVESTKMIGKGGLILTGRLGDVMQESAKAALSYLRSKSKEFKIPEQIFRKSDIHIHVPSGGIPKDGPSAGVTILTSLYSLFKNKRARNDIAMTGEITLRGLVLPVGGIKEKVLAAKRAGIYNVIIPEKNRNDLIEIPHSIKNNMKFYFVKEMDEVLKLAFDRKKEM